MVRLSFERERERDSGHVVYLVKLTMLFAILAKASC
jgi:hypothetical protein